MSNISAVSNVSISDLFEINKPSKKKDSSDFEYILKSRMNQAQKSKERAKISKEKLNYDDLNCISFNDVKLSEKQKKSLSKLSNNINSIENTKSLKSFLEEATEIINLSEDEDLSTILDDLVALSMSYATFKNETVHLNDGNYTNLDTNGLDELSTMDFIDTTLDSIEDKLQELSPESASSQTVDSSEFIEALSKVLSQENSAYSTGEKEEILLNSDKFNISLNTPNYIDATDSTILESNEMHPIAKFVLSNIQTQLSSTSLSEKTIELRLKLFPNNLGKVTVEIEKSQDGIRVKILSETGVVKDIIENSMQDLKNSLSEKFASSISIDVGINNSSDNSKNQNNNDAFSTNNITSYVEDSIARVTNNIELTNKILDIKL